MGYFDSGNRFEKASPVVLNIIIANVIVFIAQYVFGKLEPNGLVNQYFALHNVKSENYGIWQILTHMFMHGGIMHILLNMYGLYTFGSIIEKVWGSKKFLFFYFACGIGAALAQLVAYYIQYDALDNVYALGASGAVMGVVVAFGYLFPNSEMMLIPIPIPIKAKWLVIGIVCFDLYNGIANRATDNVARFAHLGGALTGFLIVLYWNKTNKKTFY